MQHVPCPLVSNSLCRKIAVLGSAKFTCCFALSTRRITVQVILIMGRPRERHYWDQVTTLEDGKWRCGRCGLTFKGGVARIKAHLDKKGGQGIRACSDEGSNNNSIAGPSNLQGAVNAIDPIEGPPPVDTMIGSGNIDLEHLVEKLTRVENDIKKQLQLPEYRGKKRKRQVDDWLKKVESLKNRVGDMNNLDEELESIEDCETQLQETIKKKPLVLSNEFVGKCFEENIGKMWKLLEDDQVFIIGVYGMGGVGKTSLVTHMEREITRTGTFNHVFWVTASQGFSIWKLQNDIAETIGVNLNGGDERKRAAKLSLALEKKENSVLILDDVWKVIDLEKVGIPLGMNGIKLILTSRLKHVCHQMDCHPNNIIRMDPVDKEGRWELFLLKLGHHEALAPEVLAIARSVVEECDGLPHGICVMAKTMKGVEDIHRWRHALDKLQNYVMGEEMEEEIFMVLKPSYDNLIDKKMQNCFLYCALHSQVSCFGASWEAFTMLLVDEGLINGISSLEKIFDAGFSILGKLSDHSLLLGNGRDVRMHGLVRQMACHIGSNGYMIKVNKKLTQIPHTQEWTADLEKVSLMDNSIREIPTGISPCCPQLSTLNFRSNPLFLIPDCFFSHMNALAVLDLSYNPNLECLPNSVSNLRSLVSLLLRGCRALEDVPPLGELQQLSRLDISHSSVREVPQGLEMLINLKWLDLSWNDELTLGPRSVLPGLTNMQYLDIRSTSGSIEVEVEDVQGMSRLEYFGGSFSDCQNFNDFVQRTENRGYGPKTFDLRVGNPFADGLDDLHQDKWRCLCDLHHDEIEKRIVYYGDCEEFVHLLPSGVTKLHILDNEQWKYLCDDLAFRGDSSLREIVVQECPKLERLFCSSPYCSFCRNLQKLESLRLWELESLHDIWGNSFPLGTSHYSHLRDLRIWYCPEIETLMTARSTRAPLGFGNLETIEVKSCHSMKKLFTASSNEEADGDPIIELPKLKRLTLIDLPQLKTVCREIMVSGCREILDIRDCPNLERRPDVKNTEVFIQRFRF